MDFPATTPQKIDIKNIILEHALYIQYRDCDMAYEENKDFSNKISKFKKI